MLYPPGFHPHSLATTLGTIAYYTADQPSQPQVVPPVGVPSLSEAATGDRRETLVFLHGFGGGSSAYEWSKVYPAFASEYRILAPDLLGWGRSDHPARDFCPDDYLTTIQEFLENTCDRPVRVVASSLVAALVVRVAIAHPHLFHSLILTCPSGLSDFGSDYRRSFFAQMVSTPVLDRVLYFTALATEPGIRNFLEQRQFARANRVFPEIVDAYLASARQPNAEYSALSFVRGDLCFDLATYIPQLTTPTAMIWGEKAQFTGVELGRRLAALNPQAIKGLDVLDDVGLTPQLELPAVTIGLIRRFIALLSAAQ